MSKPAWASQVAQWYRVHLSIQEMQETQVQSLGWEDPLDQEMANPPCYSCLGNPMDRGGWWALFNILMVIGVSALLGDLLMEKNVLNEDLPFLVGITLLFAVFIIIGWDITNIEGIILLIILIAYIIYLIRSTKKSGNTHEVEKPKFSLPKSIVFMIIGLAGIVIGGDLVVDSASYIAIAFGMSETLVGLTIVAVGTSLPELVTSITALKKGAYLLKYGRRGKPKFCPFRLANVSLNLISFIFLYQD